ncbi:MAG TPA: hypothetical protein DEP66_00335 [Acidimicrobiaceae bacterium]|nr:hypothetical protein [Acidimicrobiaceae bacterium]HCB36693.1 hypothetical protein [Acidimicrobiaceae bacterium]
MADIDWLDRVRRIRQYSSGGKRAPHKPLLLLYALAQLQQDRHSALTFEHYEPKMKKLLTELGSQSATAAPARHQYPFVYL